MTGARTIAAAQTVPVRGDVEANVAQHLRLIQVAAAERAQVLVFPELSLTGYEMDRAADLAFSPNDPRLAPLLEAVTSRSITLIVGAPVRMGTWLHIGAFILAPDGTVQLYTKQRLGAFSAAATRDGIVPPAEATVFQPGNVNPLVRFGGNVGAVAVCADTGRPSHPREAADRGATTYFASMFVIPSEYERETAALRAYAERHGMVVAFANYGGPSGGLASAGRSAIWSERGEPLAQLESSGVGVAVASEGPAGWRARGIMLAGGGVGCGSGPVGSEPSSA
jgi:predicted amidohydrolase